ncbi:cytochrome P450 [Kribbella yunnanensis]|uniref:Cytochrome P450 n=1 Tax=Kribbella yunnanensis TaxID=190194 RepID=A0ABP4UWF2_9ACTN
MQQMPIERTCPFSPPPEYARLRAETPIAKVGLPRGEAWAISTHEGVRQMLTDPKFSSSRQNPKFPLLVDAPPPPDDFKPSLIVMDPPQHGPARRAVLGEFTLKRINAMRPRIQQIVDDCLDEMLSGPKPTDLVAALSLPVPSLVICDLLGVPYADHEFFQTNSHKMVGYSVDPHERMAAIGELRNYLDDLVSGKEAQPTDDLLGRQILKQREAGTADHDDLVGLAFLLLVAGHETSANMISLGTLALLENPEQLDVIRNDPSKTPGAVEELLRYFTIAESAALRVAVEDTEIGGTVIHAGEAVIGLTQAANRDPQVFDDPDTLNVERSARGHLAFGFGAHQCLGQNLARLELQIVFDALVSRVPGLALATSPDKLSFKNDASIYGLYELPVTW